MTEKCESPLQECTKSMNPKRLRKNRRGASPSSELDRSRAAGLDAMDTKGPNWAGRGAGLLLCALVFVFAACDGSDSAPGTMTATVVSPNGAEGAAHVTIFGPGVVSVGQIDARTYSNLTGDTMQVVVVRDQPGQLRFSVQVADTTRPP